MATSEPVLFKAPAEMQTWIECTFIHLRLGTSTEDAMQQADKLIRGGRSRIPGEDGAKPDLAIVHRMPENPR